MKDADADNARQGWLSNFFDYAEEQSPWTIGGLMLGAIVVSAACATYVYWYGFALWQEEPLIENWQPATFLGGAIISFGLGVPFTLFWITWVRRVRSMRDMLQEAIIEKEMANRAKTEFLATMSHEIRTPLNGVLGMAQVLQQTSLTPEQTDALSMISKSGDVLMAIINDVLDLSKIEAGQLSLAPAPDPLADLIGDTVALFQAHAAAAQTELRFDSAPNLPARVIYDSVRTRQCVANLVSNAIKFTRKGKVTVRLRADPSDDDWLIRISVQDTGIGIEPSALKRLFKPFEQASETTAQRYGGTGLGLALSRRFARLMGGELSVASEPGQGSRFEMIFRAARVEDCSPCAVPDPDQKSSLAWVRGLSVLVVDDSLINRKVVQGLMAPLSPKILEAAHGREALNLIRQVPVDLVMLDMHMPVMDGRTTLAALRALPAPLSRLPVIALTADVMHGRREAYLAEGFQGYLSKPLRRADLQAELLRSQAMIEAARSASDAEQQRCGAAMAMAVPTD